MSKKYNSILKKYYGYDKLKDKQYEIIKSVVKDKRDVCGILATGYGKSVCYQLPYLITKKNVIVISPLIALMLDQKDDLTKRGIPVCSFDNTNKKKKTEKAEIILGETKIIYITPEYLPMCENFIKQLYKNDSICCVAIDESHCVSSWGNEFRSAYTKLNVFKEWMPDIPIIAMTATATSKVKDDIVKMLCLDKPLIVTGCFYRPNLNIFVKRKTDIELDLRKIFNQRGHEYTIVYCRTRDETSKISDIIRGFGVESLPYHAGMFEDERNDIQSAFIEGRLKCIVATIAFGMGINVPNVRTVIHCGCPKNLESYYQEIGRAGRDGLPSNCYMIYSSKDFTLNRFLMKDVKTAKHKTYLELQNREIEKYAYSSDCRWRQLLCHFNETIDGKCGTCDNCLNKNNIMADDITREAYQVISLINEMSWNYCVTMIIDILVGSKNKKITSQLLKSSFYDCARLNPKKVTKDRLKKVIRDLIFLKYLDSTIMEGKFSSGTILSCSHEAVEWLMNVRRKYDIGHEEACLSNVYVNMKKEDKIFSENETPVYDEPVKTIKNKPKVEKIVVKKRTLKKKIIDDDDDDEELRMSF